MCLTLTQSLERAVLACRNSLFLTDPSIDRATLASTKGQRVSGTCAWIRETPVYQSWLRDETRLLWICSGPGKGKKILAIFLTEELESIARSSEVVEVIYYFCSSEDRKRNTASSILRGLLWQMVTRDPARTEGLLQYFASAERTQASLSPSEALWSFFIKLVLEKDLNKVFCVLDGLDECDEDAQRWFANKVNELKSNDSFQRSENALNIVIVSRDIPPLRKIEAQINLDTDHHKEVRRDVERFVSSKVEEMSTIVRFDPEFQGAIERQLLERSEGTFLWVGFAVNELLKKKTSLQIEDTLRSLPKGLPGIYDRLILQIDPMYREACCLLLHWVALAVRPLSLKELGTAIGTHSSALLSMEQAVRDHVIMCGPVLTIQHYGVNLAHQSVREYLLRPEADRDKVLEQFRIKPAEAHLQLASCCLSYMEQSGLQAVSLEADKSAFESLLQPHPLLDYAVWNWFWHARCSASRAEKLLKHPSQFFNRESELRDKWWKLHAVLESREGLIRLPALHLASYLGIAPWARKLLNKKSTKLKFQSHIDKSDSIGQKPLHYAAWRGHSSVVQLLLEKGADVDAYQRSGKTALHEACISGHIEPVRLLVGFGADVNKVSGSGRHALHLQLPKAMKR